MDSIIVIAHYVWIFLIIFVLSNFLFYYLSPKVKKIILLIPLPLILMALALTYYFGKNCSGEECLGVGAIFVIGVEGVGLIWVSMLVAFGLNKLFKICNLKRLFVLIGIVSTIVGFFYIYYSNVYNVSYADYKYWANLAMEKNNPSLCDRCYNSDNDMRPECYLILAKNAYEKAKKDDDPQGCEEIFEIDNLEHGYDELHSIIKLGNECYSGFAQSKQDVSYCGKMKNPFEEWYTQDKDVYYEVKAAIDSCYEMKVGRTL